MTTSRLKIGGSVVVAGVAWACLDCPAGAATGPFGPLALTVIEARAELRGYRLREVRWDAVLRQNWAVFEDVQHPERPPIAERAPGVGPLAASGSGSVEAAPFPPGSSPAGASATRRPAVVHFGDRVKLWRIERNVRILISATVEGSAAVGDEVQVRIPSAGANGDSGWRVTGTVRGPSDVEMVP